MTKFALPPEPENPIVEAFGVRFDMNDGELWWNDKCVHLKPASARLFVALAKRQRVWSLEQLTELMWGHQLDGGPDDISGVVRAHMYRLRCSLRDLGAPVTIKTVRCYGWRLEEIKK